MKLIILTTAVVSLKIRSNNDMTFLINGGHWDIIIQLTTENAMDGALKLEGNFKENGNKTILRMRL